MKNNGGQSRDYQSLKNKNLVLNITRKEGYCEKIYNRFRSSVLVMVNEINKNR